MTSDGAAAIRHGFQLSFPHVRFVRCRWHLARLAAEQAPPTARAAVHQEARRILHAPTWDEAMARLATAAAHWQTTAPASLRALLDGLDEALAPLRPDGPAVHQRTNGLAERLAREFRRVLRPRKALRSLTTAPAWVALAVAQINARHRGDDWLPAFLGAAGGYPQRLTDFRVPLHT